MKRFLGLKMVFYFVLPCVLLVFGCTLDTKGTGGGINCPPVVFEADITPVENQYRAKGICLWGKAVAQYDLHARWQLGNPPSESQSYVILNITYGAERVEANIVSRCAKDPLLYGVECDQRKIAGTILKFSKWKYLQSDFYHGSIPVSILSKSRKAELRKEMEWPKTAPIFLQPIPGQVFRYKDPKQVMIVVELSLAKGDLHKWKILLEMHRMAPLAEVSPGKKGSTWIRMPETVWINNIHKSVAGKYVGVKTLSLKQTKYRIQARAYYTDMWHSDLSYPPVEFIVAKKMPKETIWDGTGKFDHKKGAQLKGLRRTFRVGEKILTKFKHQQAQNVKFNFQRLMQNKWANFNNAIILEQKTNKVGNSFVTELKFKVNVPGNFRVRAGNTKWKEFVVKP